MKNLQLTLVLLAYSFASFGQKTINSPINEITLYLDGAKIKRNTKIQVTEGEQTFIITGLSEKLENETVRINNASDFKVLSVTTRKNHLTKTTSGLLVDQVKDSIQKLSIECDDLKDQINALDKEKTILDVNQKFNYEGVSSVSELKELVNFYGEKTLALNREITKLSYAQQEKEKIIENLEQNIRSSQNIRTKSFKEVIIVIKSKKVQSISFDLEYIVNSAGWVPIYDLRVSELSEPIKLEYRSQVFNNTGVNWNNVNFYLSTADPRQSASKPTLKSWVIKNNSYDKDYNHISGGNYSGDEKKSITKDGIVYEEIDIPELSMEFKIEDEYAIPSDGKPYLVEVTQFDLDATYKHYAVPKIESAVFLLARIVGWEKLNLIEGEANIYFGGNYVGESYIKTSGASDTLDISLGRDNKVSIVRTKVRDYTDSKMIGNSKKDILEFEMVVKNFRDTPIDLEIQDQVPVSGDDDIVIEAINIDGAEHNLKNGMLTWRNTVEPNGSMKKDLAFSIKYPKHMSISKQNSVKKVRAKF